MAGRKKISTENRFLEKVKKQESGCWEWQAYCLPRGYGLFRMSEKHELAHRVSYQLFVGPLHSTLDVMHSCDNPRCVNPTHLRQGTRTDNMQDCKRKGRNTPGEKHGGAKLTEEQAKAVKAATGYQKDIAKLFGISQSQVSEIKKGTKWAHLT